MIRFAWWTAKTLGGFGLIAFVVLVLTQDAGSQTPALPATGNAVEAPADGTPDVPAEGPQPDDVSGIEQGVGGPTPAQLHAGRTIAAENCGACHSIDIAGASPDRRAPPFRTFANRFAIRDLEEALAEGLMSGHPDMPEFVLEPDAITDLLSWMESLPVTPN